MESQPQNPEFRNNPKNFHPCAMCATSQLPEKGPTAVDDAPAAEC